MTTATTPVPTATPADICAAQVTRLSGLMAAAMIDGRPCAEFDRWQAEHDAALRGWFLHTFPTEEV